MNIRHDHHGGPRTVSTPTGTAHQLGAALSSYEVRRRNATRPDLWPIFVAPPALVVDVDDDWDDV